MLITSTDNKTIKEIRRIVDEMATTVRKTKNKID